MVVRCVGTLKFVFHFVFHLKSHYDIKITFHCSKPDLIVMLYFQKMIGNRFQEYLPHNIPRYGVKIDDFEDSDCTGDNVMINAQLY